MSYLHTVPARWPIILTAVFLVGSALGCSDGRSPEESERVETDRSVFGDPYQIVTNEVPALPDEPPSLESDTLTLQVSYAGGCEDHRFDLDYISESDTTKLWVEHGNGGDSCEEEVFERLEFTLPEDALENRTIVLLNPHDNEPFMVRWGLPASGQP